ncbi:MAG: hypothetical protein WBB82_09495 [Limnothrix sp.]
MSSLDDLLQELENQHMTNTPPPEKTTALDEQLTELQQQSQSSQPSDPPLPETITPPANNVSLDDHLAALQQRSPNAASQAKQTAVDDNLAALQQQALSPDSSVTPPKKNIAVDDNLAALQQQALSPNPGVTPPKKNIAVDDNLAALQQQLQQKPTVDSGAVNDSIAAMLSVLEKDSVEKKLAATQQNQQIYQTINQLIETKKQQPKLKPHDVQAIAAVEKQKQQREKYWQTKAETWLKNLDPISNEGLWFSEFADGYNSPLDAAIDYLMALE